MKKLILLLIIFVLTNKESQGTWTTKQSVPFGISNAGYFAIGNYGYIVCGNGVNDFLNSTFQYDPTNDIWTQKADAGTTLREGPFSFSVNGKGYIGGGVDNLNNVLNDLLQYDPVANTWTSKAHIPQKRFLAATMVSGTKAFVCCGATDDSTLTVLNDMWEYSTSSNTWTSRTAFPGTGRYAATGFSSNGNCYLFGGSDSGSSNLYNDLWDYNVNGNSWNQVSDLPADPRGNAIAFTVGNYAYLGCGGGYNNNYNDFWRYDFTNDIWLITDTLSTVQRDGAFSLVINNTGYVGGGEDFSGNLLADFWQFSPDSNIYVQEINSKNTSVSVGPNPVISSTTFYINTDRSLTNSFIRIYNLSGKLIDEVKASSQKTTIDFSTYKKGEYYFGFYSGNSFIRSGKILVIGNE